MGTWKSQLSVLTLALATLWLPACSSKDSTLQSSLSCSVAAAESPTVANAVIVSLSCGGGTAPYSVASVTLAGKTPDSIAGSLTGFATSTTLTLYDYSRTDFEGLGGTITVYGTGTASTAAAGYSFTVAVAGGGAPTTTVGCTITPNISAPVVGQSVTFTLSSNLWGTAPYTFHNFSGGGNSVVSQAPTRTSDSVFSAVASFSAVGTQTVSASVYDNAGVTKSCSTTLTVAASGTSTPGTSGLSCVAWTNPTASARGQTVQTGVSITNSSGSAWLEEVLFAAGVGVTGQFTSSTTAVLSFTYAGSYGLQYVVENTAGQRAYCSHTHMVY